MSLWRARPRAEPQTRDGILPAIPMGDAWARWVASHGSDATGGQGALQAVAVWGACDLIASLVSELPVHVYRGSGSDRRELTTPSWLDDPDGGGYGLEDWRYRLIMSWLTRGNSYGQILQRSAGGFAQQVDLLHPDCVAPQISGGDIAWQVNGSTIPRRELLHLRVNPQPGVLLGLSPIELHALTIGLHITSTKFGQQWFADGAHPSAMLTNSEVAMSPEQAQAAKDRFVAAIRGSREPVVLGRGWAYETLSVTPEESQFLQTQGYSAAECARIFGPGIAEILGYQSGGSLTYANVQDRGVHLLTYSVGKWIRRTERVLSDFLPRPQYVKLDRDALLETSTVQRYQAYTSALNAGWRTINEVRDDEDLPPVAWGDSPLNLAFSAAGATGAPDVPPQSEPTASDAPDPNAAKDQ